MRRGQKLSPSPPHPRTYFSIPTPSPSGLSPSPPHPRLLQVCLHPRPHPHHICFIKMQHIFIFNSIYLFIFISKPFYLSQKLYYKIIIFIISNFVHNLNKNVPILGSSHAKNNNPSIQSGCSCVLLSSIVLPAIDDVLVAGMDNTDFATKARFGYKLSFYFQNEEMSSSEESVLFQ